MAFKKAGVLVQSILMSYKGVSLKIYGWIETAREQQRLTDLLLNFSNC